MSTHVRSSIYTTNTTYLLTKIDFLISIALRELMTTANEDGGKTFNIIF